VTFTFWECAGLIALAIVLWSCRRSLPAMIVIALVVAAGLLFVGAAAAVLAAIVATIALRSGWGWLCSKARRAKLALRPRR
jgi:hypothetical protein